jgi:transcriptional regulator with XRE-family HTH domain
MVKKSHKLESAKGFKDKLNWLIENHKKPNGSKWSDKEIAEATDTTRAYIYRLRNDPTVSNPSLEIAKALGRFFGVGLRFFDDDFDSANIGDLYDTVIGAELAMRSAGLEKLSDEDKLVILRIIDSTIKASQKGK